MNGDETGDLTMFLLKDALKRKTYVLTAYVVVLTGLSIPEIPKQSASGNRDSQFRLCRILGVI